MLNIVISILLYPGFALALVLALLLAWLTERRLEFLPSVRALGSLDVLAACASVLLASIALALLPWPYHPAAGWRLIGQPIAFWCALEGSFLLGQLPGLLAPAPLAARAATRELQMGVAGRCVFWLAVGIGLWGAAAWSLVALPGRLLVGFAGLLALPAAIGSGPFGSERSLSAAGAEEGLDEGAARLVRLARAMRGAVALAALIVASAPLALGATIPQAAGLSAGPQLQPWIVLLLCVALFIVVALLLRQVTLAMPRLTLPAALRWCWWRALPLALIGLVYLIVI